jgi:hypothetical protein
MDSNNTAAQRLLYRSPSVQGQNPAPRASADPPASADLDDRSNLVNQLLDVFIGIASDVKRIADVLDPEPPDLVGTPYLARQLGVTTTWIADMVRQGEIPASCLVPGTGNGKPWKFYRARIDQWLASR